MAQEDRVDMWWQDYERGLDLRVVCIGGCGQKVPRNLSHDHGVCAACWEIVQQPPVVRG